MIKAEHGRRIGIVGLRMPNDPCSWPIVEKVLEAYRSIILARMETPYQVGKNIIMSLIIEVDTDRLGALTGKLGMIKGVRVKSILL